MSTNDRVLEVFPEIIAGAKKVRIGKIKEREIFGEVILARATSMVNIGILSRS